MNTSQYIPYESVSAIMLKSLDASLGGAYDKFLSGTGFFVKFPPYLDVFFVTARHCVIRSDGNFTSNLLIPVDYHKHKHQLIPFSTYLEGNDSFEMNENNFEDILVFVVGDDISDEIRKVLLSRALSLTHQENVDDIINSIIQQKGKIRTVGFPDVSTNIDYENNQATIQPRGFHADLIGKGELDRYKIDNLNWKECGLNGFSGSPILALCPQAKMIDNNIKVDVIAIPIGVFVTSQYFISINVVTNLIAEYFSSPQYENDKKLNSLK